MLEKNWLWLLEDIVVARRIQAKIIVDELHFKASEISIYPNPVTDLTEIKFEEIGNYQVEIMDITGKIIYSKLIESIGR